ncbi:MAG: DNA polymerase III subunit delta' [Rhodobacteraceae bacterium]|nr:DNA polymerase III subunit delta' [Paracoccaceae bacterium]
MTELDRVGNAPHPRFVTELFGQRDAEKRFLAAYNAGRADTAWLITGPRGVGKATLAWRIARFALSAAADSKPGSNPHSSLHVDATHPTARRIAALSETTLTLIRRQVDTKSGKPQSGITVGQIRSLIDFFALTSADNLPIVAIIDSADDLNTSAANALLKLLEEPPDNSMMLLVSHSPFSLPATIRSRCRFLSCKPLGEKDMRRALAGTGCLRQSGEDHLSGISVGSVGETLRFHFDGGFECHNRLLALLAQAPGMKRGELMKFAEACGGRNAESQYLVSVSAIQYLLSGLARWAAGVETPPPPADCSHLIKARHSAYIWAELNAELFQRFQHSRLTNLDPVSVVLDMLIALDKSASAAARQESHPHASH